ncbi:hypothetical protein, partial [Streptomyces formicae]
GRPPRDRPPPATRRRMPPSEPGGDRPPSPARRMNAPQPWRPEDFEDECETCGAPPGQLCRPRCDTGYTAQDFRRDAVRRSRADRSRPPRTPPRQ